MKKNVRMAEEGLVHAYINEWNHFKSASIQANLALAYLNRFHSDFYNDSLAEADHFYPLSEDSRRSKKYLAKKHQNTSPRDFLQVIFQHNISWHF
jgi:hypothetical protein